jgi:hypothetical protein
MPVFESYIDHCVAATKSIDPDAVRQLELGAEIGRGTQFSMRHLGKLAILGRPLDSGLKIPNGGRDRAGKRLQQELTAIELLLSQMPEHVAKVPQFMTLLAIEGRESPAAILTEDATKGGELPIMGLGSLLGMSERARSIAGAFKRVDGTRVNASVIDHSFAFRVGEEERFLDFTPPPVKRTGNSGDNPSSDRIYELIANDKLTVTINAESPLSRSLANSAG